MVFFVKVWDLMELYNLQIQRFFVCNEPSNEVLASDVIHAVPFKVHMTGDMAWQLRWGKRARQPTGAGFVNCKRWNVSTAIVIVDAGPHLDIG
jgi:hypothetical protein